MDTDMEDSTPEPPSSPEQPTTRFEKTPKKSNLKLIAENIHEHQGTNPPIAGYFPSGFGYNRLKKRSDDESAVVTTFRNEKKPKRFELVVNPGNSCVDYVATNYSGEAAAGKTGGFALVYVDKAARSFKVLPLASSRVLRLEPKVRRADTPDIEPETALRSELSAAERLEQVNSLIAQFGTAGALKRARKAQRLRQKEDPAAHLELDQIMKDNPVDKAATESTTTDTNHHIPPHNLTASTPERAYPLSKIILKGEWDYLNDILELVQAGKELTPDFYPNFVCNRSHKVELLKDETEKRTVAGTLSYITHLITFRNKHLVDGVSDSKHHKIPSMLSQKFSRMFLDPIRNRVADDKFGVLISYVLVLTLHIDEFETDFRDIARDLKMTAVSLRPHFETLGCKFKRRNNVTVATLPVPLQFQTVDKRRKRRG